MNDGMNDESKFEKWVKETGVGNLVVAVRDQFPDCAVTYSAVYQWLRAEHEPRPRKARALVAISAGAITLQDIHDHFEGKAGERHVAAAAIR